MKTTATAVATTLTYSTVVPVSGPDGTNLIEPPRAYLPYYTIYLQA